MRVICPSAKMQTISPFVIPISSELRPREMIHSLREASEAIKNGEIVCIFAEGQITRIGQMLPFRRGFERIMKDVNAPIIPVALDGVWGSIFSFEKHRFVWKLPRRIPYPVTVNFGKAMPHNSTPFEVRAAVQELMAEAWKERKTRMQPLHRAFVRTARLHPLRFAMADTLSRKVNFGPALVRTVFLARRLKPIWAGQKMVGLLLPPSVPGALANFAALLMGKTPVNLNYTVSQETLASCIRQCDIKTVVTSKAFLGKVKLELPCDTILLEQLVGARPPTAGEKLTAILWACFLPAGLLEKPDPWYDAYASRRPLMIDGTEPLLLGVPASPDEEGVKPDRGSGGSVRISTRSSDDPFCRSRPWIRSSRRRAGAIIKRPNPPNATPVR